MPCGLSSWSTKRPFAKLRAFSSSSAGTGSSAIRLQLVDDRRHRLVDAVDVDAGLRVERAGVGVAWLSAEDVVGEPAPLAHLGEEARRHPAAEHGREQLQDVAVGMLDRVARDAEAEVRLVGLLREDLHAAVPVRPRRAPAAASRRGRGRRAAPRRARASGGADAAAEADDHPRRAGTSGRGSRGTSRASRRARSPCGR